MSKSTPEPFMLTEAEVKRADQLLREWQAANRALIYARNSDALEIHQTKSWKGSAYGVNQSPEEDRLPVPRDAVRALLTGLLEGIEESLAALHVKAPMR